MLVAYKQRLGRNAAAIEADAAQLFVLLDEQDFFAQVGGVKRGGVTARAGAQHHNFSLNGIHGKYSGRDQPMSFSSKFSKPVHDVKHKPHGRAAVDHAVIVGQRQRQHQARLDFSVAHHRFQRAAAQAEDGRLPAG